MKTAEEQSETKETEPIPPTVIKRKPSIFSRKRNVKEDFHKITAQKLKESLSTKNHRGPIREDINLRTRKTDQRERPKNPKKLMVITWVV